MYKNLNIFNKERKVRPIKTPTSELVAENVRRTMQKLNVSITDLASVMNVSRGTIYNRFLNPDEFQIGELDKFATYARKHGMPRMTAESFFKAG